MSLPTHLLWLFAALAGYLGAEPTAEASPSVDARPFLYELSGGQQPSYLFGTMHAGVYLDEMSSSVVDALGASKALVVETLPPKNATSNWGRKPLDMQLADVAWSKRQPVVGLESWQFQASLLQKLSNGEGVALPSEDDIQQLAAVYRSGDLSKLEEATAMDPSEAEPLLWSRNRSWLRALAKPLAIGGLFVAVGAGHLPGAKGLLAGLDAQGVQIRQVST